MTDASPAGRSARRPMRAIVLSGGGARGAYEAGVLRFVLDELPKRLGHPVRFDVVSGTSVGAIHACFLAAMAHEASGAGARLAEVWQGFRLDEVLPLSTGDFLRLPRRLLGLWAGATTEPGGALPERIYGVLDTQRLSQIVERAIPWRRIRRNVTEGRLEAVAVAATQIATGRTVVFVENRERRVASWTLDPSVEARPARLLPAHALASASIPILFPAVRVASTYYSDGGLRLNTPLMPTVYLGADRVLVVGLSHKSRDAEDAAQSEPRIESYGNPIFLFGKVLNALLLDHLDTDLGRMRLVNEILRRGETAFGPDFLPRLNAVRGERGQGFRRIDDLVIRPSVPLGSLAANVLEERRGGARIPAVLRLFLRTFASPGSAAEADLVSYLMFDAAYAAPVMELGYADARAREDELLRFFSDEPFEAS
jgi:NTE family protein